MRLAANMRRLFRSRGGGSHRDVSVTEEAGGPLESNKDQEARVTYTESEKSMKDGLPKSGGAEARGDGQTLNGRNCRTSLRNRCYRRDSE